MWNTRLDRFVAKGKGSGLVRSVYPHVPDLTFGLKHGFRGFFSHLVRQYLRWFVCLYIYIKGVGWLSDRCGVKSICGRYASEADAFPDLCIS